MPAELTGGPHFEAFCSRYLRHTQGRWAGRSLALEPWQQAFVWEALELDPVTGLRVYSEVGLGLPRKNGKSTLAAGFGLYFLAADGEAEPQVYVGAGAKQQAGIVMRASLQMARKSVALAPYVKPTKYQLECPGNGGMMRALSSEGGLQHGLNPHLSLIDEVHAHKDSTLWTALTTAGGARDQPMTLWITTAGVEGEGLLADLYGTMYAGGGQLEVLAGGSLLVYRDREAGVLIYWYGAPKDADPDDPAVWLAANPASWMQDGRYLTREHRRLTRRGQLLEWRQYHLDQMVGVEESWLPPGSWAPLAAGQPDPADPWHGLDPQLPVGVGIKRAGKGDTAAVVVAQRSGDRLVVRARHFAPSALTGRVNTEEMRQVLRDLRGRFGRPTMRDEKRRYIPGPAFAYDSWAFGEAAEALEQDGLNMVHFPQAAATMGPASTSTYEAITTGRLAHDGDPLLARQVEASAAVLTERGMRILDGGRQDRAGRTRGLPNPACIALAMAVAMALHDPAPPPARPVRRSTGAVAY